MSTITEVEVSEPLFSVQTRVSWGALLAGAVVAIASYSLLTMLGIAIGLTLSDRYDPEQLGLAGAIWTFATLLVAMFFGGWVATRCTAGELRTEAILYGIVVWGITSTLLIPLTAAGIGLGSGTMLADRGIEMMKNSAVPPMVNAARIAIDKNSSESRRDENGSAARSENSTSTRDQDRTQNADTSSSTSDQSTASADNNDRANTANDSNRSSRPTGRVRDRLITASWWSFAGTFVSMLSAIFGALLGPHVVITHRNLAARPIA